MNPKKATAILALIGLFAVVDACTHKVAKMLVAYDRAPWDTGEIKKCEEASGTSSPPDRRGDVLLCDVAVSAAWAQSQRDAIYEAGRTYSVTFLTNGRDEPWVSGNGHDTFWDCKKTTEGIECR